MDNLENAYLPAETHDEIEAEERVELIAVSVLVQRNGAGAGVVITSERPTRAFLVPVGHLPNKGKFELNIHLEGVAEINTEALREFIELGLLPEWDIFVDNILKSFLRAGAYSLEDLSRRGVKREALRTAFPYRIVVGE